MSYDTPRMEAAMKALHEDQHVVPVVTLLIRGNS